MKNILNSNSVAQSSRINFKLMAAEKILNHNDPWLIFN